ncbi:uncharacterized protein LOC131014002 [Salvia miltiorrhiza]|uniref:uncharacterized protein LOC131014002 n=1 Tax=Salvia miltiorrhiza TaxID=226208 RepID=UPI0025AC7FE4|nr:uncharacterized protein LOC131014002 [Salvia miltiorrhiza]
MVSPFPKDFFSSCTLWKTLVLVALLLNLIVNTQNPQLYFHRWAAPPQPSSSPQPLVSSNNVNDRTNLSHIAFGLMGSVQTWPQRRGYLEAWWRPNKTRGHVFLDRPPPPELLPWPETAPPYKLVDDLSELFRHTKPRFWLMPRMVHGISELLREVHDGVRWVVMGDDDSVFFVDNIVDVLAEYDHNKYYYLGWHSESVISNYWYSFDQAFGGGGIVLSYPLATALARDMDACLLRYADSTSADLITMTCIADVGVNLTPHKGIHQVDLHGDFSGYLSAHPKVPVLTFHHFDAVEPIFPSMDRMQSTHHLMKAADADQSRLLQQTICYHKKTNWSLSISWGYSAQIYERIMPRSYLQLPIETFTPWANGPERPFYMFNTRPRSNDSCEAPHFFFFESVSESTSTDQIITTYTRANQRGLPPCLSSGNHSADFITEIQVISTGKKRLQIDRCECCDIVRVDGVKADVTLRECKIDEIIA